MNRSMKKLALLLAIAVVLALVTACNKHENMETTSPAETVVMETSGAAEEATTEETMSPELQKALEESWIMEDWPEETTEATEATKPQENKPQETKPQETKPQETKPQETKPQNTLTEYEKYLAMSAEEQQAFFQSFDSVDAYFEWLNKAKAEYEEKQNATEIENGTIDLSTMPVNP